jgi:hypothetical protein
MYTNHSIVLSVKIVNMNVFVDGCGDGKVGVGWGGDDGITVQTMREIYRTPTELL